MCVPWCFESVFSICEMRLMGAADAQRKAKMHSCGSCLVMRMPG